MQLHQHGSEQLCEFKTIVLFQLLNITLIYNPLKVKTNK